MSGSTKTVSTTPREIVGLRNDLSNWLRGPQAATSAPPPKFNNIKMIGDVQRKMWEQQQAMAGAQGNAAATGGPQPRGNNLSGPLGGAGVNLAALANAGGMFKGSKSTEGSPSPNQVGSTAGPQGGAVMGPGQSLDFKFAPQNPAPGGAEGFDRMFTQSMDQLGGANSPFFQNMMAQLNPMFEQQRADAVAAAREGAGNLTGSGYGNIMGSMMNRTLGSQQAMAADLFQNLAGMEMQRQQGDAGRFMQTLLGMSTAGVAPEQVVQSGGMGSILGPVGGILGTALAGPVGAAIGGKLGGLFGGGGGGASPAVAAPSYSNPFAGRQMNFGGIPFTG